MKDATREYRVRIAGMDQHYTAHSTLAGARSALHAKTYSPVVVMLHFEPVRGMFDAFPAGHPLPQSCSVIERFRPTSSGKGRWDRVSHPDEYPDFVEA